MSRRKDFKQQALTPPRRYAGEIAHQAERGLILAVEDGSSTMSRLRSSQNAHPRVAYDPYPYAEPVAGINDQSNEAILGMSGRGNLQAHLSVNPPPTTREQAYIESQHKLRENGKEDKFISASVLIVLK